MAKVEVKDDRRYTKDHEWAKSDGDELVVGVSAFAVEQLGDITMVTIDVSEGDEIEAGKPYGTVESVKTLADLFAPVSGKVLRSNEALEDEPELINDDCYDKGWLIAIAPSDASQVDGLLDAKAYTAHLETEES
ncbi:MAG: glycine cleavage system protein GcvH [Deltaproteobacteria bacterium]|nr:MAG: glycine cleavage system protein GcvH [Deltaproteobacteria bacterium]